MAEQTEIKKICVSCGKDCSKKPFDCGLQGIKCEECAVKEHNFFPHIGADQPSQSARIRCPGCNGIGCVGDSVCSVCEGDGEIYFDERNEKWPCLCGDPENCKDPVFTEHFYCRRLEANNDR